MRARYAEWRLRNDTTYDDQILVDNDGNGWLTWMLNDHTEPMLRPLGITMKVDGHTYSPLIQMSGFGMMGEVHSKTRKKAIRLGRRLAKDEADRDARRRRASRPVGPTESPLPPSAIKEG
jgi:hypothetical protein